MLLLAQNLQEAVDALGGKGGVVAIPPGRHVLKSSLRVPSGVTLRGAGAVLVKCDGAAWFAPFHFGDVLVEPGRTDRLTPQEMVERGMLLVGSVDTVARSMERLFADTPVQWLFAWTYNGLIPHATIMRSIDLFARKVLPRFDTKN